MKKNITVLSLVMAMVVSNLFGQSLNDSTSMEAFYTNQVFYSLSNGEVANIDNNNWELGFSTSGNGAAGSSIILNEATTTLWAYPGDISEWSAFDTTGYEGWEQLLNTDTSWTNGAFNVHRGASGTFDMGWGVLNPMNNYWTFGDSLYLVKLSDNSFRKLWIVSLKSGTWEYKYANIDGSNEQTFSFLKTNYPNRNFVYHSILNNVIIDREPDNTTWDLMFAKHTDYVNPPGTYVSVSSVFTNKNVWSAKAYEANFAAASTSTTPQTILNQNITNIGREWKKFSSSTGWTVFDSIAYFVYDNDSSSFYRLVFTGFGGMMSGKTYFNKELLQNVSVNDVDQNVQLSIYPNPTQGNVTLLVDYPSSDNVEIKIVDLSGKLAYQNILGLSAGINQKVLDINHLTSGVYIMSIRNEKFNTSQKLIIR
ncbi:MAG: T9SS type A sorting domain-containing protein [Flavobacteriales bacterium]|nr:T9SS type A sorting domain-containing protein [Flavobacteriales bacterium]MCB9364017.1 T9SS type A sorting domain-containing protein [Flavobacteriales bacterium]